MGVCSKNLHQMGPILNMEKSTNRLTKPMANTWQEEFPYQNLLLDKYEGTSPVGSFD